MCLVFGKCGFLIIVISSDSKASVKVKIFYIITEKGENTCVT